MNGLLQLGLGLLVLEEGCELLLLVEEAQKWRERGQLELLLSLPLSPFEAARRVERG